MDYPPVSCIGGGAKLRTVPSMPTLTPHRAFGMSDRLDYLEQEVAYLRAMRNHEEHSHVPQRPFLPDTGLMGMQFPPMSQNASMSASSHLGQQQLFMPMPLQQVDREKEKENQAGKAVSPLDLSQEHTQLLTAHRELLETMKQQTQQHTQLMHSHMQLMTAHSDLLKHQMGKTGDKKALKKHPSLGVVRLDYQYPPAGGDTDCPASFGYDVFYRAVPGLTFEVAQAGTFDEQTERHFAEAIKYLEQRGCSAITGDCGFMMAFQVTARKIASKPIFMSSMVQCPVIAAAFEPKDKLLVLTANGESLKPQKQVLMHSCGFNVSEERFVIRGCQEVPGFDAVAKGEAVPLEVVQPGILKLALSFIKEHPAIKGILLECTELPPYADALRAATGLPVWDCITAADFYIGAFKDNPRFGVEDWQAEWDQEQEEYTFGMNLIEMDRSMLKTKVNWEKEKKKKVLTDPKAKAKVAKTTKALTRKKSPILGVVRLDYDYPPAGGDIDCPGSYDYEVLFRAVPGLTFEMAQSGHFTSQVKQDFKAAIHWLEAKGVSGITGDCGFMMAFQPIAAQIASVPVFMSSMMQCPMVSIAFDKYDKVIILTANSKTLKPQKDALLSHCGFDVDDERFMIFGCQDVPGFDAVARGEKVDVEVVTPGIVSMVVHILKAESTVRAILLECTELPPYADALRAATGLPVFDAITCADFFISAYKDNPRFGLNQWQNDWDEQVVDYEFGQNLSAAEKARAQNL